jgi:hypothetical protein
LKYSLEAGKLDGREAIKPGSWKAGRPESLNAEKLENLNPF